MGRKQTETDIQYLPGVGPKKAELLRKELNINTFGDLIKFYPFRYIDRSSIVSINMVRPEMAYIQIRAKVLIKELTANNGNIIRETADGTSIMETAGVSDHTGNGYPETITGAPTRKQISPKDEPLKFNTIKRMKVIVGDETGRMGLVFFKGIKWMYSKLEPGKEFIFFGKASVFNGFLNMVHPEVDNVTESSLSGESGTPESANRADNSQGMALAMTGIYPSTERLKNGGITGRAMNKMQEHALNACLQDIEETLPVWLMKEQGLVPLHFALRNIHFPKNQEALERSKYRLKFEELFFLQLALLRQKYRHSKDAVGIIMPKVGDAFNRCYEALPFPLTGAQKRVITEIRNDMKSGRQMNRLLQGDVGSGKTMVAVLTALIAVGNGYQVCIMAPTEVLAQQHFKNISKYLAPTEVKVALLTGSSKTSERREIHAGLEDGSIGIIVGTHALIEDAVTFRNLGLAIVDEQHRFGVEQRAKLWRKTSCGLSPHILVMTATPIPRTLAMTLYGDLDVSVIDELPPGRKPVQTIHATESKRNALFGFMKEQIALGRQIFVVYPLIFESEKTDYKNLENGYEQIVQAFPFPPYKTAIVHGKQTNDEKKFNMDAFAAGRADILVATSVIEVGVDVPNASVMVIESAERFGLSQLHQLRGRVGRGSEKSYCVLMTGYKLSKDSKHRIELMCNTENGFELAEEDMKMRGPGDLEGTQQSGLPVNLNIASLAKDGLILNTARSCAEKLLSEDPELSGTENRILGKELKKDKYNIKDYSKIS